MAPCAHRLALAAALAISSTSGFVAGPARLVRPSVTRRAASELRTVTTDGLVQLSVRDGGDAAAPAIVRGGRVTCSIGQWAYRAEGTDAWTELGGGGAAAYSFLVGDETEVAGLNLAILRLKPGAVAELTVGPTYAYGPAGLGPIPPNATLRFDLNVTSAVDYGAAYARPDTETDDERRERWREELGDPTSPMHMSSDGPSKQPSAAKNPEGPRMATPEQRAAASGAVDPSSSYVSGEGQGHTWTESAQRIDVVVPVVDGKDVAVDIRADRLRVAAAGAGAPAVDAPLHAAVVADDSSYYVEGGTAFVSLKKQAPAIWGAVFRG